MSSLFQFAAVPDAFIVKRGKAKRGDEEERRNDIIYFPCWIIYLFESVFFFRLALSKCENVPSHLIDI